MHVKEGTIRRRTDGMRGAARLHELSAARNSKDCKEEAEREPSCEPEPIAGFIRHESVSIAQPASLTVTDDNFVA